MRWVFCPLALPVLFVLNGILAWDGSAYIFRTMFLVQVALYGLAAAGAVLHPVEALLLADRIFGTLGESSLRSQLERDSRMRWLAESAFRQLAGRTDPREPTAMPFGTLRIHLTQLLLKPGPRFKLGELVEFAKTRPHPRELLAAIPDEAVTSIGVIGDPDRARDRMAEFHEAGVDDVVLVPCSTDADPAASGTLRAAAEIAGQV